jgi:ATP-dependent helicase/DNAse subunit B
LVPPFDPELGRYVHRVLEEFGKRSGFLQLADWGVASATLQAAREAVLADQASSSDLLSELATAPYLNDLDDPERNLLAAMLIKEADLVQHFQKEQRFEQPFGFDSAESWPAYALYDEAGKLVISLRGVIDRVLVGDQGVWCVDYKTGRVDLKLVREFWSSQLFVYYLVLRRQFPKLDIILNYDRIPDYAGGGTGLSDSIGDLAPEHPVITSGWVSKRNRITLGSDDAEWSLESIHQEILAYVDFLKRGVFPLTARDEQKACAHCHFERICRKTALPR